MGAVLEKGERVLGVGVLAEHHHARIRMLLTQMLGGPDALVGVGGRHADVGEDDVGLLLVDGLQEGVEVLAHGDQVDLRLGLDELPDSLAHEVVVLGEDDADSHDPRIWPIIEEAC